MATDTFYFDEKEAQRVVDFVQTQCLYIEGEWAGKPFTLLPWQKKIVRDVFGWKRKDGTRRYRTAYVEIPRKNGKSTLLAPLALYTLLCDKEIRPQIYSAAGDNAQARIVFDMARDVVAANPVLGKIVKAFQHHLVGLNTNGFYKALSSEAYTKHGLNAHAIFFDELHVQPNRNLWDVLATSQGAQSQPLTFAITTAGFDRQSICWEMHQRALAAIAEPESDPYFYPVIYGADILDDWTDEAVWAKANPSLGHTVKIDYLREAFQQASVNPALENTFRNLHLNQWTEQAVRAISMSEWDKCPQDASEELLLGETCYMGVDLASTRDIAAVSLVFPRFDDQYCVLSYFWVPEKANSDRADQDRNQFRGWVANRQINVTDGNQIDFQTILSKVMELCGKFDVREIACDPWNAVQFMQSLAERGYPPSQIIEFRQQFGNFNEPMSEMLSAICAHRLDTGGNPVLRWMAANVALKRDSSGCIRPDKEASGSKIDGIVAMLMGLGRCIRHSRDMSPSVMIL